MALLQMRQFAPHCKCGDSIRRAHYIEFEEGDLVTNGAAISFNYWPLAVSGRDNQ